MLCYPSKQGPSFLCDEVAQYQALSRVCADFSRLRLQIFHGLWAPKPAQRQKSNRRIGSICELWATFQSAPSKAKAHFRPIGKPLRARSTYGIRCAEWI